MLKKFTQLASSGKGGKTLVSKPPFLFVSDWLNKKYISADWLKQNHVFLYNFCANVNVWFAKLVLHTIVNSKMSLLPCDVNLSLVY